ncbi:MAG: glycosyltransferase family 4 protein [Candidatus Staskawiczbacteria bacterium]|nr:glycosyltransferase family 4 protein [Candidatus Staskawiczbacteria bacterium]MBI3337236.1 glycosyltransferase family 4 protein [Candidatus Staskawiczbacteria bacterium]
MKIFFDGGIFGRQKIGGISRLGFELIKELGKNKEVEQILYRGFYVDSYPFKKRWFSKYYGIKRPDFLKGRIFNLLDTIGMELAYKLNMAKDLTFHSLYYRVPKKPKGPVIVHCYDMIQELFGGNSKTIQFKKKAFDAADLIIAISESTKKDICRLYPIDPQKVIVAYPGVSEVFFKNRITAQKPEQRPYLLYIGGRNYAYKNFDMLLNTFIDEKYYLQFDLTVFGGEKDLSLSHKKIIEKYNQGTWFRQESGTDEKLAGIYANATLFIYPSLYEGFGIPPLEAMACGCPVVASNASSIPEAVLNAALLFDPSDSGNLAENIEKILHDKFLSADLIKKGKIRARQFTWQKMADTIYEGYLGLLKTKNS